MDWEECCDEKIAKEVKPDLPMVKSLIISSENKIKSESMLEIDKITAASKISLAYDSLRELLEALALKKGYKIYNHKCYSAFLKEIIQETELGNRFDRIRKIRNSVNYYGKDISIKETTEVVSKIRNLRDFIYKFLKDDR